MLKNVILLFSAFVKQILSNVPSIHNVKKEASNINFYHSTFNTRNAQDRFNFYKL